MKVQRTKIFNATFYTQKTNSLNRSGGGGVGRQKKGGEDQREKTKMPTRGMAS